MKALNSYYSVELKNRSHYIYSEDRIIYTCKKAITMKNHFKGRIRDWECLCECIDDLVKDGQSTMWFNDYDKQFRVVYEGDTIVRDEQITALVEYSANAITSRAVAKIFGRDEDCVREILGDFQDEINDLEVDEEGMTADQEKEFDEILNKYAKQIIEL